MYAPIIIFCYNRPYHLNKLLDSLIVNKISKLSKIFIFCDGPKDHYDKTKIKEIKKILKEKKLKIHSKIFRKKNIGLANSVIVGVTQVLKKYKSCIVLEDDLFLNENCIKFMNIMLKKYKNNKNIGSVSAYSYLDEYKSKKKFDFYISKRHSSWCWGTWAEIWNEITWENKEIIKHFNDKLSIKKLSQGGNDLNLLLWGQIKKLIDSWAIRFNFFCIMKSLKSIQPRYSMIRNDGRDFSGTHEKFSIKFKKRYDFNPKLGSLKDILSRTCENIKIDLYIKNYHRRSYRLSFKFFFKYFKII